MRKFLNSGDQRTARAKKNICRMFLLKGVSILCSLMIVPLTIDYVSSYEYGIWLTISSLVAWLSFFDIGIGNGLRNKVIEAVEHRKPRLAQIYVSTAYAIISLIVSIVWLVAIIVSFFMDWCSILNADRSLENELMYTVFIVVTNFSLLFVLGLNRTLLNAIQKPAIASAFDTITQVLLCLVLLILIRFTNGSLLYLALAMGGSSLGVFIISNVWTYTTVLKSYRPSIKCVRFRLAKDIMSMGFLFFILQILAIAFYQTNNLIITQFVGPDEVTVYNVAYKYMQVLTMIFTILITPFWSAFAEANVNGDYVWMQSATKKLIKMVGGLAVVGLIMVAISPIFYQVWLHGNVTVPLIITLLVCLFHVANMWSSLWTQLLCGFGKIRLQTIASAFCCLSYVPLACIFCKRFGLVGLLSASLVTFFIFTSWFGYIQVHKLLNRTATGIWNR